MVKFQGIYKITNIVNGKFYIGSSMDIKKRWEKHRYELRRNEHCNSHLQNAWNKYGDENFKFEVVAEVKDVEMILPVEQLYIEMTKCYKNDIGYNKDVIAKTPYGYIISTSNEEINKLIRNKKATNNSNIPNLKKETKVKKKNPNFIMSNNQREKLSKAGRGKNRKGEIVLTEQKVKEISLLLHNGASVWDICKVYDLADKAIRNIKLGIVWKDVINEIDFDSPLPPELVEILHTIKKEREKPKSKRLTPEQVENIEKLLESKSMTQKEIAIILDVTIHQVKGVSQNYNK